MFSTSSSESESSSSSCSKNNLILSFRILKTNLLDNVTAVIFDKDAKPMTIKVYIHTSTEFNVCNCVFIPEFAKYIGKNICTISNSILGAKIGINSPSFGKIHPNKNDPKNA